MNLSIDDLKSIHDMISEPERECMKLREKLRQTEEALQRKTSECEQLKEELCMAGKRTEKNINLWMKEGYIIISLKKLKKFLSGIKDTKLMGFIIFLVQRLLPKETDAKALQLISETAPEELPPDIYINAEGDVKVEGSYYNLRDNDKVNIQNP